MGRRNSDVTVTENEREQLESIARSRSLPHGLVRRARIVLDSADGIGASELSRRHGVSRPTVSLWRKRWRDAGLAGLHTELRPGRPRSISDEKVAELIATTLERNQPTRLIGVCVPWLTRPGCRAVLYTVISVCSGCSPIVANPSNYPMIRFSSRKCETLSGSICLHRKMRSFCA